MNAEILSRVLWTLALIAAGIASYALLNRFLLWRATRQAPLPAPAAGRLRILYFTTPDCVPCKTIQRPALQQVLQTLGNRLEVLEINTYEQPDLARQWGVLSVPTTYILDAQGKPRHVNHGVTVAQRLIAQINELL
jgi:thiol-disulfide isomerase/thioredoxin